MEIEETDMKGSEILEWVKKEDNRLLDARSINAFNGWRLNGEKQGGHIPGATSFPSSWLEYDHWEEELAQKDIQKDDSLLIYGYGKDKGKLASKLAKKGYGEIKTFEFSEYEGPVEKLPRYEKLVPPAWIKDLIDGKEVENFESEDYVIGHASYGYEKAYEIGHIPGAIHIDTLSLEDPETWNRRSAEELEKALLGYGITSETTVIMYGRFASPDNSDAYPGKDAGHLGSIRCALIMLYAGVKDVRILNGGLSAWEEAGYEITEKETRPQKENDFGAEIPAHPEYMIDMPEAKELIASDNGELVSVRSWGEYVGEKSGYNYIGKTGRIPGSVFGNSGSDAYHMENYRNIDHTLRQFHEIKEMWRQKGIVPEKRIAFYCGTGWRASEAFFNAYMMGWDNIAIYDGGWFEWSSHEENPIETGDPG